MSAAAPSVGPGSAVLAFDVGGTDIKSALIDADGTVLGLRRDSTPAAEGDRTPVLLPRLREIADELRAAFPDVSPQAAGLVVPGIVDAAAGVGVFASNLGWRDAPLRDLASQALEMPVAFDHDVRTASWAEVHLGAAGGAENVVVLVIGTGIAGSILLGGQEYTAGGYAGEIGHTPVADAPACACGARGCLETLGSAGAIVRRYAAETGRKPDGAADVIARADAGDAVAARVWSEALDALATALAQVTAIVAPDVVVLGGGLSRAGDALLAGLRERLEARLSFHRVPELRCATLGGDAGLLGAALRARELT